MNDLETARMEFAVAVASVHRGLSGANVNLTAIRDAVDALLEAAGINLREAETALADREAEIVAKDAEIAVKAARIAELERIAGNGVDTVVGEEEPKP